MFFAAANASAGRSPEGGLSAAGELDGFTNPMALILCRTEADT